MFSLGFGEILVICVILIIVVGPERLPTVMKGVGKTMRTVREASREIRSTVGLDELMRDDPPRPVYRPPPSATVARAQPLPAPSEPAALPAGEPEPNAGAAAVVPADPPAAPAAETPVAPSAATATSPPGAPTEPKAGH